MRRGLQICLFAIVALSVASCKQAPPANTGPVAEADGTDEDSVEFEIKPIGGGKAENVWLATYSSSGKTARFRIELEAAKEEDTKEFKNFTIGSGNGRFVAEAGSDASVFLADLKKALEANTIPSRVQRVATLPFTYVRFGRKMSSAPGAGFKTDSQGDWTTMKIFLVDGKQEAEVFLNYNLASGKAQFSIKDSDYGDLLLAQFAKVF
jgi:hypothetical protein